MRRSDEGCRSGKDFEYYDEKSEIVQKDRSANSGTRRAIEKVGEGCAKE